MNDKPTGGDCDCTTGHGARGTGNFFYNVTLLAGKTAVGLGVGITAGIGVLAAVAVAEVTIPAILIFKALGLTGGAIGFLQGTRTLKKSP